MPPVQIVHVNSCDALQGSELLGGTCWALRGTLATLELVSLKGVTDTWVGGCFPRVGDVIWTWAVTEGVPGVRQGLVLCCLGRRVYATVCIADRQIDMGKETRAQEPMPKSQYLCYENTSWAGACVRERSAGWASCDRVSSGPLPSSPALTIAVAMPASPLLLLSPPPQPPTLPFTLPPSPRRDLVKHLPHLPVRDLLLSHLDCVTDQGIRALASLPALTHLAVGARARGQGAEARHVGGQGHRSAAALFE